MQVARVARTREPREREAQREGESTSEIERAREGASESEQRESRGRARETARGRGREHESASERERGARAHRLPRQSAPRAPQPVATRLDRARTRARARAAGRGDRVDRQRAHSAHAARQRALRPQLALPARLQLLRPQPARLPLPALLLGPERLPEAHAGRVPRPPHALLARAASGLPLPRATWPARPRFPAADAH
eukprot:1326582-Prymnesium_polylepis.1